MTIVEHRYGKPTAIHLSDMHRRAFVDHSHEQFNTEQLKNLTWDQLLKLQEQLFYDIEIYKSRDSKSKKLEGTITSRAEGIAKDSVLLGLVELRIQNLAQSFLCSPDEVKLYHSQNGDLLTGSYRSSSRLPPHRPNHGSLIERRSKGREEKSPEQP